MLRRDLLFHFNNRGINFKKTFKKEVSTTHNILQTESAKKLLYELKHLISATKENFETHYLALLNILTLFLKKHNEFEKILIKAIMVLKFRRGYMLPIGANAESCYQQQDAWTLALFGAVLVSDCGPDKIKLIPNAVLERLKIYPDLYNEWEDYLNQKAGFNNHFLIIIKRVEDVVLGESTVEDSIKDQFIRWLRRNLNSKKISINQDDSLAHRVSKGIFLVFPELWQKFISQNPALSSQASFAEIFDDSSFIRSENADFDHCYCLGPWENGRAIHGVIIKLPLLLFPQQAPPINKNLTSNPLDESNES